MRCTCTYTCAKFDWRLHVILCNIIMFGFSALTCSSLLNSLFTSFISPFLLTPFHSSLLPFPPSSLPDLALSPSLRCLLALLLRWRRHSMPSHTNGDPVWLQCSKLSPQGTEFDYRMICLCAGWCMNNINIHSAMLHVYSVCVVPPPLPHLLFFYVMTWMFTYMHVYVHMFKCRLIQMVVELSDLL